MLASDAQIVHAYETLGMSVGDIATLLGHEPVGVKAVLAQHSEAYVSQHNSDNSSSNDNLFSEAELACAKRAIASLLYADSEAVKLRAARFVVDEHKGRNDVKSFKNLKINVSFFNERLARAREAKELSLQNDIDV